MTPLAEFQRFLTLIGGRREAATAIKVSPALIDHILAGRRTITLRVAEKIEQATKGGCRKEVLLWGSPKRSAAA